MVTLSDFVGSLLKDIATARTNADYNAAAASELYHADPFIKSLPIPHYVIDEAEIDVPVMVVGITSDSEHFQFQKEQMLDAIKEKLPLLLLRSFKWNFINERLAREERKLKEQRSRDFYKEEAVIAVKEEEPKEEDEAKKINEEFDAYKVPPLTMDYFVRSVKRITQRVVKNFEDYNYNYEVIKLLEITEDLNKDLARVISEDLKTYNKNMLPYLNEESVNKAVKYIGNIMFFTFKNIMTTDHGVKIEAATALMGEYTGLDCLMRIKLKVREQDLNLVVEDKKGKETRYLSLV